MSWEAPLDLHQSIRVDSDLRIRQLALLHYE